MRPAHGLVRLDLVPVWFAAVLLAGCGYAGEPKAPALRRPMKAAGLAAVERGAKIVVTFTLPLETTEGLPVAGTPDVELRIGVLPAPWNQAVWEANAERVPVPGQPAPPGAVGKAAAAHAKGKPAAAAKKGTGGANVPVFDKTVYNRTIQIDVSKYVGKSAVIGVRVHGPKGRDDGWSIVSLEVLPPLRAPGNLQAVDARSAVHLQWTADAPAFRIFRRLFGENRADSGWTQIGESTQATFDDTSFEYGKKWQYYVQAVRKVGDNWLESDASETITFAPADRFPPAVPAGLIVISGTRTIELRWDPVTDSDLAGYRVYRNGQQIADALVTPAYSDKDVVTGTKYSYQVSAVNQAGYESAKCKAEEVVME